MVNGHYIDPRGARWEHDGTCARVTFLLNSKITRIEKNRTTHMAHNLK